MSHHAAKHARHSKSNRISVGFVIGMLLLALCIIVAGTAIVYGITQDMNPIDAAKSIVDDAKRFIDNDNEPASSSSQKTSSVQKPALPADKAAPASSSNTNPTISSASVSSSTTQTNLPTPVIAEYRGLLIHSPIEAHEVYGILFHQASYPWALVLETKLPELDANVIFETHQIDIPADQPTGDVYMNAGALHVWRVGETTEMDTSIDVGAAAGTPVYAPVTGSVILVSQYSLYDICDDYEIHIQPDGLPDVDCVTIHIKDVCVKEGDRVEAGVTPIATVRDIAGEGVDGIHLAQFSDKEHGNHAHVQLNDMNYEGYKKAKFKTSSEASQAQSNVAENPAEQNVAEAPVEQPAE